MYRRCVHVSMAANNLCFRSGAGACRLLPMGCQGRRERGFHGKGRVNGRRPRRQTARSSSGWWDVLPERHHSVRRSALRIKRRAILFGFLTSCGIFVRCAHCLQRKVPGGPELGPARLEAGNVLHPNLFSPLLLLTFISAFLRR